MPRTWILLGVLAALAALPGCTTKAGKRAMNKPIEADSYSAFDREKTDTSKRKAETPEPVSANEDPDRAVSKLMQQLQGERAAAISAEEQLMMWGRKQGVGRMVYGQARQLLKNPRLEIRAPALRLTDAFGGREAIGELIEVLDDPEYGMRMEAYNALTKRTTRTFGFDPQGGEVQRAKSVAQLRRWWQAEQSSVAVQPASVYEKNPPKEPTIVRPGDEQKNSGER
jgi:hypothetical protein